MAHEKTFYGTDFHRSCSNCKFCDTVTNTVQATAQMFCRRNAPAGIGQCIGMDQNTRQPAWAFATAWPAVTTADWCGEYARKVQA